MASDERDEGRWIAGEIEKRHAAGEPYEQMAVFYRTNAQSRMLEDMLLRAGVPYRIVGGTRFFERKEIQDVMSYLILAVNPADDMAAMRVINEPKRGIGKTSIEHLTQNMRQEAIPFLYAAENAIGDESLRPAVRRALSEFVQIIRDASTYEGDLRKVVELILDKTGIIESYQNEGTDEAQSRIENIQELLGVVDEFVDTHSPEDAEYAAPTLQNNSEHESEEPARLLRGDSLADFVEWVRLRTDLDNASNDGHAATLMTVHASKGLEFDTVFVAGMEESLFPHLNSMGEATAIEEERRLAYVAITRARKRLYLSCATQRQLFGSTHANPVSRFLKEIPEELRQTTGIGSSGFSGTGWEKRGSRRGIFGSGSEAGGGHVGNISSSAGSGERSRDHRSGLSLPDNKKSSLLTIQKGDLVDHKTFGRGVVQEVDGDTLQIRFTKSNQTKKLLAGYAPLVKISKE